MPMNRGLARKFFNILGGYEDVEESYNPVWERFWKSEEITEEDYVKVTGKAPLGSIKEVWSTGIKWVVRNSKGQFVKWVSDPLGV